MNDQPQYGRILTDDQGDRVYRPTLKDSFMSVSQALEEAAHIATGKADPIPGEPNLDFEVKPGNRVNLAPKPQESSAELFARTAPLVRKLI